MQRRKFSRKFKLEGENGKLKHLLVEAILGITMLKVVSSKCGNT
jgi:hypothetical protein